MVVKQKVEQDKRGEGGSDGLVPIQLEVAQGGGTLRLVLHFQWQVRRGSHNATALRARPPAATRPHTCVEPCIYAHTPVHPSTHTESRGRQSTRRVHHLRNSTRATRSATRSATVIKPPPWVHQDRPFASTLVACAKTNAALSTGRGLFFLFV